jgi:hypothetical protein
MLSDEEMYERMRKGWRAGLPDGTVCGNGSTLAHTANVRRWLPRLVDRLGIVSVCDAGAGDLHWVKLTQWVVDYEAFDLIPRRPEVQQIDISTQQLPICDAILCRMVLNHLDEERIQMALHLFRLSARYLIATQFNGDDLPKRSPQFTRLDLRYAPYDLGEPLESVQDGAEGICSLAVWKL